MLDSQGSRGSGSIGNPAASAARRSSPGTCAARTRRIEAGRLPGALHSLWQGDGAPADPIQCQIVYLCSGCWLSHFTARERARINTANANRRNKRETVSSVPDLDVLPEKFPDCSRCGRPRAVITSPSRGNLCNSCLEEMEREGIERAERRTKLGPRGVPDEVPRSKSVRAYNGGSPGLGKRS